MQTLATKEPKDFKNGLFGRTVLCMADPIALLCPLRSLAAMTLLSLH